MRRYVLVASFLVSCNGLYAQRAAHWYFGYECGIDFTTGQPVADTTGSLISIEGSATISDMAGNLLFYTNGQTLWNKNHVPMPDGQFLVGDQSAVQSSVIVPHPLLNGKYYVFTNGMNMSAQRFLMMTVVDMNLDNGNGDVIPGQKNLPILQGVTEDLAATLFCRNGTECWVVVRTRDNFYHSNLYAYKVDINGYISPPVITPINVANAGVGNLSFSQDGQKAVLTAFTGTCYVYDFDSFLGTFAVTDSIQTGSINDLCYSAQLSPDNSKLYLSFWRSGAGAKCIVAQYDMNSTNIQNSRVDLSSVDFSGGSPNGYGFTGRLQLAPDQRIYLSRWHQNFPYTVHPNSFYSLDSLDVIHSPNAAGIACNFQKNYLHLKQKVTMIGLPNFVSQFTAPQLPADDCFSDGIHEIEDESFMELYPNPVTNNLNVRFKFPSSGELTIYDATGRLMYTEILNAAFQHSFNVVQWSTGVYEIRLNGKSERFVVMH